MSIQPQVGDKACHRMVSGGDIAGERDHQGRQQPLLELRSDLPRVPEAVVQARQIEDVPILSLNVFQVPTDSGSILGHPKCRDLPARRSEH